MKKIILAGWGAALAVLSPVWADNGPVKIVPSPSVQVPLHLDWFSVHYDEVRDVTTFETTGDPFGPGAPAICDKSDVIKVDLEGILDGRTFGPGARFTAKLTFWRMAGLLAKAPEGSRHPDRPYFEPTDSASGLVYLFQTDPTVHFLTRDGFRFTVSGDDIEYDTKFSTGFLGEGYTWERVTAALDWRQLNSLADGGKVAIADREITFRNDQVSLIRTLIEKVKSTAP